MSILNLFGKLSLMRDDEEDALIRLQCKAFIMDGLVLWGAVFWEVVAGVAPLFDLPGTISLAGLLLSGLLLVVYTFTIQSGRDRVEHAARDILRSGRPITMRT